jgi:hypothetical protein
LFLEVVDHSHTTTFSFSCDCPADFSHSARATNDLACFWILKQETL